MQNSLVRKGIVLGIIVLFVGASATPIIGMNLASKNTKNTNDFDDSMLKTNQIGGFSKHQPRTLNKESMTSGTIKVSIRDAIDGSDITSTTKTIDEIPIYVSFDFTEFDFPDIDVDVNHTYYIVVETSGVPYSHDDWFGWIFGRDTNYTNGEGWGFYNGWGVFPDDDFCFETTGGSNQLDQSQYEYYYDPEWPDYPYAYICNDDWSLAQSFKPTLSTLTKVSLRLCRKALTELELEKITLETGMVKSYIENVGDNEAVDVVWSISFIGGIFLLPKGGFKQGNIIRLEPQDKISISTSVLGFGGFLNPLTIKVSAYAKNTYGVQREVFANIFLIFFL